MADGDWMKNVGGHVDSQNGKIVPRENPAVRLDGLIDRKGPLGRRLRPVARAGSSRCGLRRPRRSPARYRAPLRRYAREPVSTLCQRRDVGDRRIDGLKEVDGHLFGGLE